MKTVKIVAVATALGVALWAYTENHFLKIGYFLSRLTRRADRVRLDRPRVDKALREKFGRAGISFPPAHTALVFFKDSRELLVYGGPSSDKLRLVHRYPVLAASGEAGPKLREGDRQVPEGQYRIVSLNPNSKFHLSLRLDYPNAFDRQRAFEEKRENLGGDIMIHDDAVSIGCIAIGDAAIEEIYRLAELTDYRKWEVISSPVDFRKTELAAEGKTGELYRSLTSRLKSLPDL